MFNASFYEEKYLYIIDSHVEKVANSYNSILESYFRNNLKKLGYEFSTDNEFYEFCKKRIHKITTTEKPNYHELYIDFVDLSNPGKFVGCYSDEIKTLENNGTITVTIG